ncbi:cation diffusion facilitator family transporter [Afipia sp. 1NLS2]|uniref:cation diffusion facilitator family transporter n=1 Tax=Afipia sp. 1NLS2 TaxID=666684 RepID=UPI0001DA1589|nr:cation diffusion facilitator family transporter [Afipia sp. 1NLS2]EFI53567.1 Heavy metal transport/detoxification protein [Afipia sp. 1NLS2]
MTDATLQNNNAVRYRITGMDCPSCAAKIEGTTRKLPGVTAVQVSLASQEMTIRVDDAARRLPEVERTIEGLGYEIARVDREAKTNSESRDLSHVNPAYKRALWIVVLLNLVYGLIEIVGGFLAGSQALKADALDFIGDGAISFLGLVAIGWSLRARSQTALLQGLFLGALGLAVFGNTIYRIFVLNTPEAELMGAFGAVALVINIASALVLIPHRKGDANVRAVWLFSRNDAIGNAAVVVAAGLVALTGSQWPDLVVAVVISALFLHSAWAIIKDARRELMRDR